MEMSLSQSFFKDPCYWRFIPFHDFMTMIRKMNRKSEKDKKKPRTVTDEKGKKRRVVPVLD